MTPDYNLQPLPAPEPGRPFVNRQEELELIHNKLNPALQGAPMSLAVVCFWGTFGIGKSWLLGELERRYRREAAGEGSHPAMAARLDMTPERVPALWREGRLDVRQVVYELWRQLALQAGESAPGLERSGAEAYARSFVDRVIAWLDHATPVLLLDAMDIVVHQDEPAFFWLEEHLVEPLALTDRVLFAFASRGELRRWRRFQVRRKVDSYPLPAFDAGTAGREIGANAAASEVLYRHAFGHPLATEYLGRILKEQQVDPSTAEMQQVEESLTPARVQQALQGVYEQIFGRIPRPLADLSRHLCVLRWVNVEPLGELAAKLKLDPGSDPIGTLQLYHLLYWDTDTASYTFAPAVRRLLAHFLELDDPAEFRQAHLAAYDYHRGHLEQLPQYLARYVPEAAYHHAIAARGGALPEGVPAFTTWWNDFLAAHAPQDTASWSELAEALEGDAELAGVLPAAEYEGLCAQAWERVAAAEQRSERSE
jgi:hypothetical protein